ncbi:MAG TPA: amidohydrolase family protein, partial [Candidatus Methylomirabilis sp.]
SPVPLDHVAAEFPTLPLIAAHGCWPWVTEALHVAFRRLNVYISPDMYLVNCPGWRDYVEAANSYLQDRFLFATAYPFLPLRETVAHVRRLPFRRHVLPKVLYGNAARLLGIGEGAAKAAAGRPRRRR